MFLCYYVAWPCDLDLWPFDLESVSCTVLLMSDPHTDFYYPTTIGYWVTITEYHVAGHPLLNRRCTRLPGCIRLRNDLYCVEWGVKLYSLTHCSHFRYLKQSLRMRRVTWPLTGGKNSLHFWNPRPQFAYSLCHFQGATTKIKPCYRQKIAFSHYEGYKVHCACAVLRDLFMGGPLKAHVIIFWYPTYLFTIQLLCGYDDD